MNCTGFQNLLGDYLDGRLKTAERSRFAEHAMQCRDCRSLLDDVKGKLTGVESEDESCGSSDLDVALEMIPQSYERLGCSRFESLITEFLDGYVPASVYHKFAEHSDTCDDCSKILTDVVYAVAACHSVHTYEVLEVPEELSERLISTCVAAKEQESGSKLSRFTRLRKAGNVFRTASHQPLSRLATASGLIVGFLGLLALGTPNVGIRDIFFKAQERAGSIYNQGVNVYSQKHELQARFERVGSDLAEAWKSLNGARPQSLQDVPGLP